MDCALSFLYKLKVSIGELLEFLLKVNLAVAIFAGGVVEDDCILPLVPNPS
jgi:hypothetical protein